MKIRVNFTFNKYAVIFGMLYSNLSDAVHWISLVYISRLSYENI